MAYDGGSKPNNETTLAPGEAFVMWRRAVGQPVTSRWAPERWKASTTRRAHDAAGPGCDP